MRKVQAELYRDIDFAKGKRGAVITPGSGKTKFSIRLDNAVLDFHSPPGCFFHTTTYLEMQCRMKAEGRIVKETGRE